MMLGSVMEIFFVALFLLMLSVEWKQQLVLDKENSISDSSSSINSKFVLCPYTWKCASGEQSDHSEERAIVKS